jgi:hypothetical protein
MFSLHFLKGVTGGACNLSKDDIRLWASLLLFILCVIPAGSAHKGGATVAFLALFQEAVPTETGCSAALCRTILDRLCSYHTV